MRRQELDEVENLLERVLPDPVGFADRLLQQFVTRLVELSPSATTAMSDITVGTEQSADPPSDRWEQSIILDSNTVLAAALGACDCWGVRPDCEICQGEGTSGWVDPDADLFAEYIKPALDRLESRVVAHDGNADAANAGLTPASEPNKKG